MILNLCCCPRLIFCCSGLAKGLYLHPDVYLHSLLISYTYLYQRYYEQKRYAEAEALRRDELATRRRVQGDRHLETLGAGSSLPTEPC
jgi:hypothetical protein